MLFAVIALPYEAYFLDLIGREVSKYFPVCKGSVAGVYDGKITSCDDT